MPGPGQPPPQDDEPTPGAPVPDGAVPGSGVPGDAPGGRVLDGGVLDGGVLDGGAGPDAPQGLSWSWELDLATLQAVLNEPAPWNRPMPAGPAAPETSADAGAGAGADGQAGDIPADLDPASEDDEEAIQEEFLEAILAGRTREVPLAAVAGRVAESLPPSPDLAGWLATTSPGELESGALPGVAASFRRLASWAQAGELAAVAEMASRSAAADDKIGVDDEGRPGQMPDEAVAQVSLALAMTRFGASWWTGLAISLTWRLTATGAALAAGQIDLVRARLIAEATCMLDDDTARAVEAAVLPGAGDRTTSQLRARLRRAVIVADPAGADRRRQDAERRAKVSLYPDEEGTASLGGQRLPGTRAAAAMARISAMARALKAAGAAGGMDLLRAQVFIGLLLDTLPGIPPAPGAPPDEPPPDEPPPDEPPPDEPPPDDSPPEAQPPGGGHGDDPPRPRPGDGPADSSGRPAAGGGRAAPGPAAPGPGARDPVARDPADPGPSDDDAPVDDSLGDPLGGDPAWAEPGADQGRDDDDDWAPGGIVPNPTWSALPTLILPSGAGPGPGRPAPGLLDLTLPWETLAGCSPEPGYLGRLGPITASQAREVAEAASGDPAVQWRVILTSPAGQAIAVTRVPAAYARAGPARAGPARAGPARAGPARAGPARAGPARAGLGLVGRVTLTIPEDILTRPPNPETASGGMLAPALRAAGRAAADAAARAVADAATGTGCAHTAAAPGYRPPPRLRDYVVARDLTCRYPFCGQPAWRGDLDHTQPWDKGGLTCSCNLGPLCRHHHILKQHPGWRLIQTAPGVFRWITPTGRTYLSTPESRAV